MAWRAEALDDRCGGLPGGERDDDALPAPASDFGGADDGVRRIVAPFHDDVGAKDLHQLERGVLVEHRHRVDGLEAGEDVGTFDLAADGAVRTLEAPDARVAVQPDDQRIASLPRTAKDVEMPRVQQVEYAVREDDAAGLLRTPLAGALPVENLARRVEGAQKVLSTRG
jgi:hypothetical protein